MDGSEGYGDEGGEFEEDGSFIGEYVDYMRKMSITGHTEVTN